MLSKVRSALRADTERIQSGYRAMVSGGGLQALPQAWSAISTVQSALRADTERIQSRYSTWRRIPGGPTGLERDLKSSELTPSGYRAGTERVQSA